MFVDRKLLLPHRIAGLAAEARDRLALRDILHREPDATWGDVQEAVLRWAGAYRRLGLREGQPVLTMMANSFDGYFAWLGAAWLRAIEVPISTAYHGDMLRYVIADSGATILLTTAAFAERLAPFAETLDDSLKVVVVDTPETPLPDLPLELLDREAFLGGAEPATDLPGPEYWDTAAMIYTSGTTGPSKGVLVPWGELYSWPLFLPKDFLATDECYYSAFPLNHLSGKCAIYSAAHVGGHLAIRPQFSPSEFWNDVRAFDVRSAGLVGPMASMLMAAPPQPDEAENPLERLMMGPVIPGAEAFKTRFGISHIATGYGTTEVGFPLSTPWNPPNERTCGRRREGTPGYEIRIVDEHDEPVALGQVGELIVRTSVPWSMNTGYWGRPEQTAEAWRNGWFHTGDAFMEDADGWFYLVDRMKDTLRRRGENISSFEVEAGIAQHAAVAECAVIGVPSELGEDDAKAVIVARPGQTLDPAELILFLEERLPRFMVPRYVEVVDALPRTEGTMRIKKVELRRDALNDRTWDREGRLPA